MGYMDKDSNLGWFHKSHLFRKMDSNRSMDMDYSLINLLRGRDGLKMILGSGGVINSIWTAPFLREG